MRRGAQVKWKRNASASEVQSEGGTMSCFLLPVVYMHISKIKQKNQGEQKEKAWNNKKEHGMEKSAIGNQNTLTKEQEWSAMS